MTRGVGRLLSMVVLACLIAPEALRAQTEPTKSATATDAAGAVPLGRYAPKDHLIVYAEFAGLDAHAASWRNTASYKMLNETPLGVMLENVSGQLLDKALTFVPNRRLSGREIVTLIKGAAISGWLFALHTDPKGTEIRPTFVMRGAASRELRPIASRLMGWMMGADAKYKAEQREGRTVVVVPYAEAKAPAGVAGSSSEGALGLFKGVMAQMSAGAAGSSWAWWPEKNDLVIAGSYPAGALAIMAALDGKAPSAVDHPVVQELRKPEGTFESVCVAFVDTAACPDLPAGFAPLLHGLHKDQGINRIDIQWGFDADALMTVTRLVAPKPWKTGLALFDQPPFDKSSLMPMPDSVESFVELSINPSKLLDVIEQFGPAGPIKAQIEQLSEKIKNTAEIDLRKDILGHLGPRMFAYLASGRSAAANDDLLDAALKNGLTTTAAVTAMQSFFPKLTLVAEIDDPDAFGNGLDTMIIAINNELEAQALAQEQAEQKAADKEKSGGAGRRPGGRLGEGAERTKGPHVPAPRFIPIPGQGKSFVLSTPSDSKLRFGPSSFRPTILVEGKYVAFAVSTDTARAAVTAAHRKDWKPSAELERVLQHVPSKLVMLSVSDVTESLSSLLASLPGTLQTTINTSIALAKARTSGTIATGTNVTGPGVALATPATPGGSPTPLARFASRLGKARPRPGAGAPGATGTRPAGAAGPGISSGSMKNAGAPGSGATASDAMIVIKVDSDQLPKAADLKAHLFPATLSILVGEQEIRFVSRSAFPDLSAAIGMVPAFAMMPRLPMFDPTQGGPGGAKPPGTAGATTAAPAAPGGRPEAPAGGRAGVGGPRGPRGPDR